MISAISGKITHIDDHKILLNTSPFEFEIFCPRAQNFPLQQPITLHIYLHWNQEQGPSLYGFENTLDKKVFLLIISCSGIGPKLGLAILDQTTSTAFLDAIAQENFTTLHKIKGLGEKKAELLCMHLKNKISDLLKDHPIIGSTKVGLWHDLQETLNSLHYSPAEIKQTTAILKEDAHNQNIPFDLLLRKALTILAKK